MHQTIWDVYEHHLAGCAQCKTQYNLAEDGKKEDCCNEGRVIIHDLETQFWNTLMRVKVDERAYQNLLARLRQQLAEFDSLRPRNSRN